MDWGLSVRPDEGCIIVRGPVKKVTGQRNGNLDAVTNADNDKDLDCVARAARQ